MCIYICKCSETLIYNQCTSIGIKKIPTRAIVHQKGRFIPHECIQVGGPSFVIHGGSSSNTCMIWDDFGIGKACINKIISFILTAIDQTLPQSSRIYVGTADKVQGMFCCVVKHSKEGAMCFSV